MIIKRFQYLGMLWWDFSNVGKIEITIEVNMEEKNE